MEITNPTDKLYCVIGWLGRVIINKDFLPYISKNTLFSPENIEIITTGAIRNTFKEIPKVKFRFKPYQNRKTLYDTLDKILQDLSKGHRVYLIGHSLGGAFVNHLAQKINDLFSGKNIKTKKRFTFKTGIQLSTRRKLDSYPLTQDSLTNLHIATFGTVWVWKNERSMISRTLKSMHTSRKSPSVQITSESLPIKMHNYVSASDISQICIGDVCKTKRIINDNNDNMFDGIFMDKQYPIFNLDENNKLYQTVMDDVGGKLCSCPYEDERSFIVSNSKIIVSRLIPICLYKDNDPACNYTKMLDGLGEHEYYTFFIVSLVRNRDLDIYNYKYDSEKNAALIKKPELNISNSPIHNSKSNNSETN